MKNFYRVLDLLMVVFLFTFAVRVQAGVDASNKFKLGDTSGLDKIFEANIGNAPINPKIKFSAGTWQFSNDGIHFFNLQGAANFIAATGCTITTAGNFKVHTCTSNQTFQITSGSGTLSGVVVAGGGGGGGGQGAGGGGGGAIAFSATYGVGSYPVTVGTGGVGGVDTPQSRATNGQNSVFDVYTATGGGYGTDINYGSGGGNGGSGGGGDGSGGDPGGTGIVGQGFAGGNGVNNIAQNASGGGGGGGAVGGNGNSANPGTGGTGGIGLLSSISGSSTYYAGGGGGSTVSGGVAGSGGLGGGGAACVALHCTATSGTVNTGGGGGGGGNSGTSVGGAGGSGVVILSYRFQ